MTLIPFQQHDRGCEKTFCPFCLRYFYFYSRISETVGEQTKKQRKEQTNKQKNSQNQPWLLIFAKQSCSEKRLDVQPKEQVHGIKSILTLFDMSQISLSDELDFLWKSVRLSGKEGRH